MQNWLLPDKDSKHYSGATSVTVFCYEFIINNFIVAIICFPPRSVADRANTRIASWEAYAGK